MSRTPAASCVAITLGCTLGCASMQPHVTHVDSTLGVGRASEPTEFEKRERAVQRDDHGRSTGKATPALFWTGIVLGTLGLGTGIGTGVAGRITGNRLQDAYNDQDTGLSHPREQRLTDAGEALNAATITGFTVGIIGYALAITVAGIDYTRCGPLAPKRRRCDEIVR